MFIRWWFVVKFIMYIDTSRSYRARAHTFIDTYRCARCDINIYFIAVADSV